MKSVAEVRAIADPLERATAAATIIRAAEAKAADLRQRRDLAVLVLLRPFADAVAATNAARTRLRDEYNAGTITREAYESGLAANREKRQADLAAADVKVYPVDIYEPLGVSRNLVNRILMRMPDGDLPVVRSPWRVAEKAHGDLPEQEQIVADAQVVRNDAARILMSGRDDDGREFPPVTNADIARATQLTTARIAQLREEVGMVGAR